jgi:hypothetical protein
MLPALLLACLLPGRGNAQVLDLISIINAAVKKAIVAADLAVERLQTETIGLQNTEKAVENDMDVTELGDIAGWVRQQRDLFAEYYSELWQVKEALGTYERVKGMIERQVAIVSGAKQMLSIVGQDKHFSVAEVGQLSSVASGIITASAKNLKGLEMVITALVTQMDDAGRLGIIDQVGSGIDQNYRDLAQFSQETYLLSLQRAAGAADVETTKALYNIP